MENTKIEKTLKVMLIIISILTSLVFILSMSFCIGTKIQDIALRDNPNSVQGFAIVYIVSLVYSSIAYGVLFFISLIFLIISFHKKSKYRKWYVITSISPFIFEILFIIMGAICSTL